MLAKWHQGTPMYSTKVKQDILSPVSSTLRIFQIGKNDQQLGNFVYMVHSVFFEMSNNNCEGHALEFFAKCFGGTGSIYSIGSTFLSSPLDGIVCRLW